MPDENNCSSDFSQTLGGVVQGTKADVLKCLANLSNEEVFTPPEVANQMLDLLPKELWKDPNAKFLDPACKSGVFLREIAKRLIEGLKEFEPDLEKRHEHIFKNQLYAISITELTGLISRRSVYCSKCANSKWSVVTFRSPEGNIHFHTVQHDWEGGRCKYCGASQQEYQRDSSLETHAYEFIHPNWDKEFQNMRFDVIISNPPYQLSVGNEGGNSAKAKAIYHLFIEKSQALNPRHLVMITPSRWMTRTTEGIPDEWVDKNLTSNHFKVIHDFEDSHDCFPGVEIKGGVNYFLWEPTWNGKCEYTFHADAKETIRNDFLDSMHSGVVIRSPEAHAIIKKICDVEGEYYNSEDKNFTCYVSPKDFFTNKQTLTSKWDGYSNERKGEYTIKYYLNKNIHKVEYGWVSLDQISKNHASIGLNKVLIPAAGGTGTDSQILGNPFYVEKNSVCSQTYLVIGYNPEKHRFSSDQCQNIISYIKTKFFRYLVSIKKKTQNGPRGVYQFVPLQSFDEAWNDKKLYKKYNLNENEISYIESLIDEME